MRPRRILISVLAGFSFALLAAPGAQASPSALLILLVGNDLNLHADFEAAIAGHAGVTKLDTFDSSAGTPTAAAMSPYDLVVDTGDDTYQDSTAYGDTLATYIDQGGALIQFAYDNWNDPGAFPTGRFDSAGYAPFVPGPNDNLAVTLGAVLDPGSPLLANVSSFSS